MNNEELIEIVRSYKYLYDVSDKTYSDNQKKEEAWSEIGNKINMRGSDCKKAWTLLRDSFRRANKKKKDTKSGKASVPNKKWKHEDEMSFLLPYIKERPTLCPIPRELPLDNEDNSNYTNQLLEVGQNTIETRPSMPEASQEADDLSDTTLTEGRLQTTASLPASTHTESQPKRYKRNQKQPTDTPSTVLLKYIIDNKKTEPPPPDDIQQFMAGIATTLKSFPAKDRAIAKAKIFNIVSQMEIDLLSRPSTTS